MEVEDVTAEHVVQIKGLNVQPLTLEQAIIVQGFTGMGTVAMQAMAEDLSARGQGRGYHDGSTIRELYREDFARLSVYQNEMAAYRELAGRVYDALLDKMENDPFAQWDSRVDVLIATHLNHNTQAAIRVAMELFHNATIEFTERPGTTDQTWIVINRPDPTDKAMRKAVEAATDIMLLAVAPKVTITIPMSIPERAETEFVNRVGDLVGTATIKVGRERFKKHQTTIVIECRLGSGAPKLEHDQRGWEPK